MRTLPVLTAGALLLLVAASCSSEPENAEELCLNPTATTAVEMRDFFFEPTCVEVDAGATLSIDNTGNAPHTFTIEGAEADIAAGDSGSLDLAGISTGTYEVICSYHPQMTGALRVR